MPVERLPGLMDYLLPALRDYAQIDQQNKSRDLESKRIKIEQDQHAVGLMNQLFQSGAVDANQLEGTLASSGIAPGTTIQPNKAQRRREVLNQGQGAVDALDDSQKEELGFKTATEQKIDKSKGAFADLEGQKAAVLGRFMNGEKLSDQEAMAVGMPGQSDMELKKLGGMDPYLGQVGERYVASQIVKGQGRIAPGTAKQVSEQAFADYVAERGATGMGGLTPEQVQYTKTFFDRATQNALIAQSKMDLEKYQAESGRIGANATATWRSKQTMAGGDNAVKWAGIMNRGEESVRKAMADLQKDPLMGMLSVLPKEAVDKMMASNPAFAQKVQQFQALQQKSEAYRGAIADLANGAIPGTLPDLLNDADAMAKGGAVHNAPVVAPPGGRAAGGATAPQAAPQGGDPISGAVQIILSGKGTPAQLQEMVRAGRITQAQYQQIMAQVQAQSKKK